MISEPSAGGQSNIQGCFGNDLLSLNVYLQHLVLTFFLRLVLILFLRLALSLFLQHLRKYFWKNCACAVFPGVQHGKLSMSEKATMQKFVSKLNFKGSKVKEGKGERYEWLFANRSYRYGKNGSRLIELCGTFSEVQHPCAVVVRNLQHATPNACLLVYYPSGTLGHNINKDDESVHTCDQVITLYHSAGAIFVLANNSKQKVVHDCLEGGIFMSLGTRVFTIGLMVWNRLAKDSGLLPFVC